MIHRLITTWNKTNLMKRIAIGIVLGVILALIFPKATGIGLLGQFFVGGLRAIAPLLVFALVANALSQHQKGTETNMKKVIVLYLLGTFAAAFVAVLVNYIFPITITLTGKAAEGSSPNGIGEVISNLLLKIVDNPVNALQQANYIGILSWATVFGIAMREASEHSKDLLQTLADITSKIVEWIINLAPFGILGLVFTTIAGQGLSALSNYGILLLVLQRHSRPQKARGLPGLDVHHPERPLQPAYPWLGPRQGGNAPGGLLSLCGGLFTRAADGLPAPGSDRRPAGRGSSACSPGGGGRFFRQ